MTEQRRAELLEGLDEYYASRHDLLNENNSHEKTEIVNGLTYVVIDNMAVEEWAKQNDVIAIEETCLKR